MPLAYPYCYYQNCNYPELRWVFIAIGFTVAAITVTTIAWERARRARRNRNRGPWQ